MSVAVEDMKMHKEENRNRIILSSFVQGKSAKNLERDYNLSKARVYTIIKSTACDLLAEQNNPRLEQAKFMVVRGLVEEFRNQLLVDAAGQSQQQVSSLKRTLGEKSQ